MKNDLRKKIDNVLAVILIAVMGILVADVLWQVACRYLLSSPSSFTDEVAGYLMIWVGLLGAAYVCGEREHLAIDILLSRSEGKRKLILQLTIHIVVALFAVLVMVIGGCWLVYTRFLLEVTSASLEINMGYVYSVLPISGLLITYYSIDNAKKNLNDYQQSKTVQ